MLYLSVIGLLIVRLAFSVIRVLQIIRQAEKHNFRDVILAIVKDLIQPFSFLQHIVLSEKDFTENPEIVVAHEYAHIQYKHALDLIICELFTTLFWFNPFMWLLRRDLKLIHEYQADEAVLNKGIDAKTYQLLVLKKAVGKRRFALANHFTQKPILKRIKMMHMKNNRRRTSLKLVLFLPALALLLQAFARPEIIIEKAGAYLPAIGQKDSSEIWIDSWVSSKMSILSDVGYLSMAGSDKTIQVVNIVGSQISLGEVFTYVNDNVSTILQNSKGELLVENKRFELNDLRPYLEDFLKGKNEISGKRPNFKTEELPFVGNINISQGTILYRQDVATPQDATKAVMKKIAKAILSVRQEMAQTKFEKNYFSLSEDKKAVINQMIPDNVTFVNPKNITKTSEKVAPPLPPVNIKIDKKGCIYMGRSYYSKDDKIRYTGWGKKVTKEELKDDLQERNEYATRMSQRYNQAYSTIVNVVIEDGTPNNQVIELKGLLRSLNIKQVNYSSEQSSESEKQGNSTGYSNQLNQYNVIITSDELQAFNKECTVENVKQEVTESLKSMKNKESISVLSFSDVPKERLDAVLNELNQVPFVKVSTTVLKLEQQPFSTAKHKILLKTNGKIYVDEKEYNLTEFETKVKEIGNAPGETNVALEVENEVTYLQSETVKQILRDANINQVGYSLQRHSVRETEPGTKIGEASQMFGFAWSGSGLPDLDKVKREAEAFLSKKGSYSLYSSIFPDKNATHEQIDVVKKVLLEAGFLKVDVQKN